MAKSAAPTTRVRDPEGTRRKILAAALQEFSAKGIDGARVDAIAARARVNKQLLYYYFDSKDGLFRAVLRERLAERSPTAMLADRTSPAPLAALQDRLAGERDWIRLLTWEALERSGRGPVEAEARRTTLEQWVAAVEEAQADGRVARRPRRAPPRARPSSARCCSRSRSRRSPNSSPARRRPRRSSSPIAARSSCSWVRSSRRSEASTLPLDADGRSALGRSAMGKVEAAARCSIG